MHKRIKEEGMENVKKYLQIDDMDKKIEFYQSLEDKEGFKEKLQSESPREYRKLVGKLTALERELSLFDESKINKIDIDKLIPNPYQPRVDFDDEKIKELAESIKENGQISPILVSRTKDNKFIIVAGERRYRAFKLLSQEDEKFKEIEAKVINQMSDDELQIVSLVENIHRENLSVYEEAKTYQKLNEKMTIMEIANKTKNSKTRIGRLIKIAKIDDDVLEYAKEKGIDSITMLELISKIDNKDKQIEACDMYADGYSIKEIEKRIIEGVEEKAEEENSNVEDSNYSISNEEEDSEEEEETEENNDIEEDIGEETNTNSNYETDTDENGAEEDSDSHNNDDFTNDEDVKVKVGKNYIKISNLQKDEVESIIKFLQETMGFYF